MKSSCPHCGQRYEIEEADVGRVIDCMHCGRRFSLLKGEEPPQSERKPRKVKFVILAFDQVETELNRLYDEGWRVVSQSTVFWKEESRPFRGEAAREERLAFVLSR